MPDVIPLADVLDATEKIIRGVRPEQQHLPTPCPKYDVGALVNHLVGWLSHFAAAASGQTAPGDPAAHQVGDAPGEEFHAAAQRAVDAFRGGAAQHPIDLGHGPQPGTIVFDMMLIEYIGHGWDLAKATGQPAPFPPEAAEAALAAARQMLKPEYRGEVFGEPVPVPDDAPPVDRLVAFIGRDPSWAA